MKTLTTNFTEELDINGHSIVVSVEASGSVGTYMFGADADGNRGEWRTEVGDDLEVTVRDARNNDLTTKLDKKYAQVMELILENAEEKLIETYHDKGGF